MSCAVFNWAWNTLSRFSALRSRTPISSSDNRALADITEHRPRSISSAASSMPGRSVAGTLHSRVASAYTP